MKGMGNYHEWMIDFRDSDYINVEIMEDIIKYFKNNA